MRIDAAIEKSKNMLSLKEGWDDDEAKKIEEETWLRMKALLTEINDVCKKHNSSELFSQTDISPCADGSIDVWWPQGLLLNVRARPV